MELRFQIRVLLFVALFPAQLHSRLSSPGDVGLGVRRRCDGLRTFDDSFSLAPRGAEMHESSGLAFAPQLQVGQARFRSKPWKCQTRKGRTLPTASQRLGLPALNMVMSKQSPVEIVWENVERACQSVRKTLMPEASATALDEVSLKKSKEQVDKFLKAVEGEVTGWVKDVQRLEEERLSEVRTSVDAVFETLNMITNGDMSTLSKDNFRVWRNLRRTTDPKTRKLLLNVAKMRGKYDQQVLQLTNSIQPLTEEELEESLGLQDLRTSIQANVDQVSETIKPMTNEEMNAQLATLETELAERRRYGIQVAEEQLRGGVERARYAIWNRAKQREVEDEAAHVYLKAGTLYASAINSNVEVPILENLGPMMYVDDSDSTSMFLGMMDSTDSSQHRVKLGNMPASAGRWLSCARQKLWWMSPDVGSRDQIIPPETQFLLQDLGNGMYCVLLPLVGNSFRSALWGGDDGRLDLSIESGDPTIKSKLVTTSLFVAAGSDPYKLLQRSFEAVADRLGTFKVRSEKTLPPSLDVFGWCTWDAFYSQVEPEGVKQGLKKLADGGTPSRLLILDDGWQSTENDEDFKLSDAETDARNEISAAELAGGGVLEGDEYAASQLTSLRDIPARLLTWWYTTVVEKSPYNSTPVRVWQWLSHNVIKNDLLKYFAEATDWSKRLTSIMPNSKFTQLGTLIGTLKADYGLEYAYCWHALTGYWLGVDVNSPGMEGYKPIVQYPCIPPHYDYTPSILYSEPTMAWNPSAFVGLGMIPPENIRDFFGNLHSSLRSAGIDGVKCDAQAAITMLGAGFGGGPKITRAYVHAMEQSVKENMGGNCINCMCHPTENIYSYRDTVIARASDDFYPREPASHTVHVVNVVYNSLFLGEIVHPDWDMFQSEHPAAFLHGAARAVGGCAVYTSDRPDVHDFDLLKRLVLPDGSILRAQQHGRPTRDCLFTDVCRDGKTALKVWNRNSVNGVVGVFNLQGPYWDRYNSVMLYTGPTCASDGDTSREVRNFQVPEEETPTVIATVQPSDVEGMAQQGSKFAVWSHKQQKLDIVEESGAVDIQLGPKEADVLTVAALKPLPDVQDSDGKPAMFASLGLPHMFNGGAAIRDVKIDVSSFGIQALFDDLQEVFAVNATGLFNAEDGLSLNKSALASTKKDLERLITKEAEILSDLYTAKRQPKDGKFRVAVAVKGEGSALFYSSAKPEKLEARKAPKIKRSPSLRGLSKEQPEEPEVWEFEHRANGELDVKLPPMSQEEGSGQWLLTFTWPRSSSQAGEL